MNTWKENYFKPKQPGAFAGPHKLFKHLKQNKVKTSYKSVKNWLQDQDAFSLLQPVKYKFKRRRVVTNGIDDLWDIDLADVSNLASHNDDMKFLLIVIDVFSKHLWAEPIPNKHHDSVIKAFKKIFKETKRKPKQIRSDKGTEFKNRWVIAYLKKLGINPYTTKNETKANFAERVIRTLKGMMYRYFLHYQTYKYLDILPDLVYNYNNRPHKTLGGLTPTSINKMNETKIWKEMYIDKIKLPKKPKRAYKLKIGDKVRISHLQYVFQRDYHQKWTQEVFLITNRLRKDGKNLYSLKDFMDEEIDGYFYEEELQKVTKNLDSVYRIEKVLKKRTRKGQKELLVKWLGWPKKFNSWINEKDLV